MSRRPRRVIPDAGPAWRVLLATAALHACNDAFFYVLYPLLPFIAAELAPGPAKYSDAELDAHMRATSITVHHPLGTCRMGEVVDEELRVRGAEGLLSGPTLSRVVADLERSGLLASDAAPEDSRVKRLRPTARTLEILMTRADAAFTEFAVTVKEAEQASA